MRKFKRLFATLSITLCLSMSIGMGSVFADFSHEPTLTAQEKISKNYVEEIKKEMSNINIQDFSSSVRRQEENIETDKIMQEYESFRSRELLPNTPETMRQFSQFAEETLDIGARAASIGVIRASGKQAAAVASSLGLRMIGTTFGNGFQDIPPDLSWSAGTEFSDEMKYSNQYKNLVAEIKSELSYNSGTYWSNSSSIAFSDPEDVWLSLHAMDYLAAAEKINGKWKIYIRFYDTYNFEYQNSSSYPQAIVAWANNWAVDAQELGALNPYTITAYTQETY